MLFFDVDTANDYIMDIYANTNLVQHIYNVAPRNILHGTVQLKNSQLNTAQSKNIASSHNKAGTDVQLNDFTNKKVEYILKNINNKNLPKGQLINSISAEFKDIPYAANQLIGNATTPEKLVIDFSGLDCFTYLDYVNSLAQCKSESCFVKSLIQTRYKNSQVAFKNRKHFFSDWSYAKNPNTSDVTKQLDMETKTVVKELNEKADGSKYLDGIDVVKREISYIPSANINESTLDKLKDGDYIGLYTDLPGLDVTHVGIFIRENGVAMLRNASSKKEFEKVVDVPLMDYVKNKPGIIVYRSL